MNVLFKIIPTRYVLFEKTLPSYEVVDQMIKDILIDCQILKTFDSTDSRSDFYYIKNKRIIMRLLLYSLDDYNIFFNPNLLYYNLNTEPYRYKAKIRRFILKTLNPDFIHEKLAFDEGFDLVNYNYIRTSGKLC